MGLTILKIVLLFCFIVYISNVSMSMRSLRNNFKKCINNSECNECQEENNYKKCENNMCYCCDFILRKCNYQN